MLEPTLYSIDGIIERNTIRRYIAESSSVSAGVSIQFSSVGAQTRPSTVMIAPPRIASIRPVCTASDTPFSSLQPKYCETMTVAPDDTPTKKPRIRLNICADDPPTAATAAEPTNWPTTTVSTVL